MGEYFAILFGAIFIYNFVLTRFLGICPFLGVSKKIETSIGMGAAVIFVMTLAAIITWLIEFYILEPMSLEYLRTIAFILVIASLVQFVEMVIQKVSPALYEGLGVFLPLITTNCAVLGMAILNIQEKFNIIESIVHAIGAALGFTLALVILAGIRERLELAPLSKYYKGASVALITAGILSIAFQGFQGMM
ncbi:electron transport complex subunit RsxA [Candidatus Contubernalis alkaliaceticus]|uniref:electron transport complex subunit RsxA n=1 Tax=Candidatus Contubernalis alkaliaceticus TaxID=338645 RepID=UPI001F4C1800|nr:electron transport complex subunit RsxA [Candidatus Contubernalis alkalaceticus]UNC90905.1 electron transport complex subunit RsxA [Candidatus Contubernalis alkalaceticus]